MGEDVAFKQDLSFRVPLINAAGSLGFTPNPHGAIDFTRLGAFVTNPISRHSRRPAEERGMLAFPGGFLLHSGFPNPGFRTALTRYATQWAEAPLPMLVHLIPNDADEMLWMTRRLEGMENIAGIELGLRDDVLPAEAMGIIQAGLGELPLIANLSPRRAADLGAALAKSGVAAFSLAPARGCLPAPGGRLARGRLYGPALLPQSLEAVSSLARHGLPVIGGGGIYTPGDVAAMRAAGAEISALDAVLWQNGGLDQFFREPAD